MIGMEMCDDDAGDFFALELGRKNLRPEVSDFFGIDAGVHQRPAVFFFDHPEIDVVELERQRHAHPIDAGGGFHHLAGLGDARQRIGQRAFGRGGEGDVGHEQLLSGWHHATARHPFVIGASGRGVKRRAQKRGRPWGSSACQRRLVEREKSGRTGGGRPHKTEGGGQYLIGVETRERDTRGGPFGGGQGGAGEKMPARDRAE